MGLGSWLVVVLVLVGSLALPKEPAQASTDVGGIIDSDTTWTLEGSPYVLTQTVQIAQGATLTIHPGVTVLGHPDQGFDIGGQLIADASSADPVVFTGSPSWRGIQFLRQSQSTEPESIFRNVVFENVYHWALIFELSSSPVVEDSVFHNSAGGISAASLQSPVAIVNNVFTYVDNAVHVRASPMLTLTDNVFWNTGPVMVGSSASEWDWDLQRNDFLLPSLEHPYFQIAFGVTDSSTPVVSIPNNWWGTLDEAIIESRIQDASDDIRNVDVDWSPPAQERFQSWDPAQARPLPTKVGRPGHIGLTLRGHLKSRVAVQGAPGCSADGVTVVVERKTPSGWQRVAKGTVGNDGLFVQSIRDKEGNYRARSLRYEEIFKFALWSETQCRSISSSPVRHRH